MGAIKNKEDLLNDLFTAILANEIDKIKSLILLLEDVNIQNIYGVTPFSFAIRYIRNNDYTILKLLLEHGAKVNVLDKYCNTPLLWACMYNDYNLAKFLLEYGAKVDVYNAKEMSPMKWADFFKNEELIKLLKKYTT